MIKCEKCGKELCDKRSMKRHHEKPLPCDFRCDICETQLDDRYGYYRHMKKVHLEEWSARKNDHQRKPRKAKASDSEKGKEEAYDSASPTEDTDDDMEEVLLPLTKERIANNDFIIGTYSESDRNKMVKQTTKLESATLTTTTTCDDEGVREHLWLKETFTRNTYLTIWNRKAAKEITHDIFYDCLDIVDDHTPDKSGFALRLLTSVCARKETPHLISMKATNDASRRTAEFFVRGTDGVPLIRRWSADMSLTQVKNMLPNLVTFLITIALPMMHPVYIRADRRVEGEIDKCGLTLPKKGNQIFKVMHHTRETDEEDEDYVHNSFSVFEVQNSNRVLISSLNLPKNHREKAIADECRRELLAAFPMKVNEVNKEIANGNIPAKDIYTFFEIAREASLGVEPIQGMIEI